MIRLFLIKLPNIPLPYLQMKLSSLTLAKAFMRRVTKELQYKEYEEDLLLQGVRFAFRIHQVTFKTSQHRISASTSFNQLHILPVCRWL